ncbi:hypothetical protein [Streptomyces sp. NPDC057557]|uniref:hypothetical protein n=1 Tax=Streptomyces sp. NPDC057557 TaxID=3346167 RepID=UPI0036B9B745
MTVVISSDSLRRIRYWDLVARVVGDAGPMATASLPRVPGLRMLYDTSDVGDPQAEVNELGRLIVEALGYPYSAEIRGYIGIFLVDAEGVPVDLPESLCNRIQEEASRARSVLRR